MLNPADDQAYRPSTIFAKEFSRYHALSERTKKIGLVSLTVYHPFRLRKQTFLTFPLHTTCDGKDMLVWGGFFLLFRDGLLVF